MNRAKLEIEERYGGRVTGNEIVQLAIDLLRDDYEKRKANSNLIRVLVMGQAAEDKLEALGEGDAG